MDCSKHDVFKLICSQSYHILNAQETHYSKEPWGGKIIDLDSFFSVNFKPIGNMIYYFCFFLVLRAIENPFVVGFKQTV